MDGMSFALGLMTGVGGIMFLIFVWALLKAAKR